MAKIKGIYKGFKYLSQIFVVKEHEMEIGYPTDVKHVAHIGWDGPSGNGPTWMNEFRDAPEFKSSLRTAAEPPGSNLAGEQSSPSQDAGYSMGGKSASDKLRDDPTGEAPSTRKKQKRRKIKSSPSESSSVSRSSRAAKSKAKQSHAQSIALAGS